MRSTMRRMALTFASVACLAATLVGAETAAAVPLGEQTLTAAQDCAHNNEDYVAGRWLSVFLCYDNVTGYSGVVEKTIYLDRADYGPNPARWAGWQGTQHDRFQTTEIHGRGTHWYRVCIESNGFYCGRWYR